MTHVDIAAAARRMELERVVPLAIGTDTAGSVRNPASACGIIGLKPGCGVLPLDGVVLLASTLDHVRVVDAQRRGCGDCGRSEKPMN